MKINYDYLKKHPTEKARLRFTCSALKWMGLSSFIKDLCFTNNLDIECNIDRGLLFEHIRCSVWGKAEDLIGFCQEFKKLLDDF